MKFCQLLREATSSSSAVKDVGRFYKQYKKALKRLPQSVAPTADDAEFAGSITQEVLRWNEFFLDTEEDLVMKYSEIERRCKEIPEGSGTLDLSLAQQLVNVHGELVLFMHWCMLAYTAVLKLLKKYHKRMSRALDAPNLSGLLSESFCSTEISSGLLAGTERQLTRFADQLGTRLSSPHSDMPFSVLGGGRDSTAIQMAVADLKSNLVNEAEDSNDEDDGMEDSNSTDAATSGHNSCTDLPAQASQQQERQAAAARQQQGAGAAAAADVVAASSAAAAGPQETQQPGADVASPFAGLLLQQQQAQVAEQAPQQQQAAVQQEGQPEQQQLAQQQQACSGEPMMVGELRAALNIWETLRDTAKTPSTVFNPALYAKY